MITMNLNESTEGPMFGAIMMGNTLLVADSERVEKAFGQDVLARATPLPNDSPDACRQIAYTYHNALGKDILTDENTSTVAELTPEEYESLERGLARLKTHEERGFTDADISAAFSLPHPTLEKNLYKRCVDPDSGKSHLVVLWGVFSQNEKERNVSTVARPTTNISDLPGLLPPVASEESASNKANSPKTFAKVLITVLVIACLGAAFWAGLHLTEDRLGSGHTPGQPFANGEEFVSDNQGNTTDTQDSRPQASNNPNDQLRGPQPQSQNSQPSAPAPFREPDQSYGGSELAGPSGEGTSGPGTDDLVSDSGSLLPEASNDVERSSAQPSDQDPTIPEDPSASEDIGAIDQPTHEDPSVEPEQSNPQQASTNDGIDDQSLNASEDPTLPDGETLTGNENSIIPESNESTPDGPESPTMDSMAEDAQPPQQAMTPSGPTGSESESESTSPPLDPTQPESEPEGLVDDGSTQNPSSLPEMREPITEETPTAYEDPTSPEPRPEVVIVIEPTPSPETPLPSEGASSPGVTSPSPVLSFDSSIHKAPLSYVWTALDGEGRVPEISTNNHAPRPIGKVDSVFVVRFQVTVKDADGKTVLNEEQRIPYEPDMEQSL